MGQRRWRKKEREREREGEGGSGGGGGSRPRDGRREVVRWPEEGVGFLGQRRGREEGEE